MSAKTILLLGVILAKTFADVSLDSIYREVLKEGLHRELLTRVTYTVTDIPYDLETCAYIFRENITKDHYIYYEEVTRDMPGFQTWPHHKPMNIEAPCSKSEDEQFIWKLPFSVTKPNSYVTDISAHFDTIK